MPVNPREEKKTATPNRRGQRASKDPENNSQSVAQSRSERRKERAEKIEAMREEKKRRKEKGAAERREKMKNRGPGFKMGGIFGKLLKKRRRKQD